MMSSPWTGIRSVKVESIDRENIGKRGLKTYTISPEEVEKKYGKPMNMDLVKEHILEGLSKEDIQRKYPEVSTKTIGRLFGMAEKDIKKNGCKAKPLQEVDETEENPPEEVVEKVEGGKMKEYSEVEEESISSEPDVEEAAEASDESESEVELKSEPRTLRRLRSWDLEEGIEYREISVIENRDCLFKVHGGEMYIANNGQGWFKIGRLPYRDFMDWSFTEAEFKPKPRDIYFYPSFESEHGVKKTSWKDSSIDLRRKDTVGVYKVLGEALEKSRELGWI